MGERNRRAVDEPGGRLKSGRCPKCGSNNVRRGPSPSGWNDASLVVPMGSVFGKKALVRAYVCTACGLVEQYVYKDEDREKIREKWKLAIEPED